MGRILVLYMKMTAASGTARLLLGLFLAAAAASEQNPPAPVFIGSNIPWNHFGNDIGAGSFDAAWFDSYFAGAHHNGSNIARFWLHAGGQGKGLLFNSTGAVTGLAP